MLLFLRFYFLIILITTHNLLLPQYTHLQEAFSITMDNTNANTKNLSSFIKKKPLPTIEHVTLQVPEAADKKHYIERKGILTHYTTAQATVILCHGFMCDKYDTGILRQLFPKGVYNVFIFDFRAHGEASQNQWCTFGKNESQEVITAGIFVKNHPMLKNKPVFAYGFSMGAVAAIEAQAQYPNLFNAMILDCPFSSSENIIKKGLENAKIRFLGYEFGVPGRQLLQKYAFNPYIQSLVKYTLKCISNFDSKNINTIIYPLYPVETIKKVTVPCFFIHCRHDEKISTDEAKTVYQNAKGFKRLWITNGRRHYDSLFYNPEKYRLQVRDFLQKVLDGSYLQQPTEYIWEDPVEESKQMLIAAPENLA